MRTDQATTQAPAIHLAHSTKPVTPRDRLLRLPEVEAVTGMKKTTIYALMRDGKFPNRLCITRRMSAWPESAVLQWVESKINGGAGMSNRHPDMDTLVARVFDMLRRRTDHGRRAMDGETLFHDGHEYGLNVDVPLQLELFHVTADRLDDEGFATRGQRSFAVLMVNRRESNDVNAIAMMQQAFVDGQAIKFNFGKLICYVLDSLPIPACYQTLSESDDGSRTLH